MCFVGGYSQKRSHPFKFSFDDCICENTMLIFSYLSPETVAIITLVRPLYGGEKNSCTKVIKVSASLSDCMILYPDQLNKDNEDESQETKKASLLSFFRRIPWRYINSFFCLQAFYFLLTKRLEPWNFNALIYSSESLPFIVLEINFFLIWKSNLVYAVYST